MTIDIAAGRTLVAEARAAHEDGWPPHRPFFARIAKAHAAALDELEQLRSRNAKLEAVVAALPRCCECETRTAKASTLYQGFGCDECRPRLGSQWNQRLTDLPYAAALRALEEP